LKLNSWLVGLTCSCAPIAPAAALMPPPVSVPVIVIANDPEAQAVGEAFVTLLREHGWFGTAPSRIGRAPFVRCLARKDEQAACVRKSEDWKKDGQAAVIILAHGIPVQTWTCVGVAAAAAQPERQSITIDLRKAIFGPAEERLELRNKAAGCIMAAGSESGW
jgi:hypothetical protein